MSMQDKLSRMNLGARKKLFGMAVHLNGTKCKVIRFQTETDRYSQQRKTLISNDPIEVYLDLPDEIPLSRLRESVTDEIAKTENVFFYDSLPIEGFAKFEDNVEKGDIIVYVVKIEETNFYFVLEVTEIFGTIKSKTLSWKRFDCSMYTQALTEEAKAVVEDWLESEDATNQELP